MSQRKEYHFIDEEKFDMLRDLLRGKATCEKTASELELKEHIVHKWTLQEPTVLEFIGACYGLENYKPRRDFKISNYDIINGALWVWYLQEMYQKNVINESLLREKANYFHKKIDMRLRFTGSRRWLAYWKRRYGVNKLEGSGENVDDSKTCRFTSDLKSVIDLEGFTAEQVYDFHETILHFKMLPESENQFMGPSTSTAGTSSTAHKEKYKITFGACSNAAGTHKLPIMVSSKYAGTGPHYNFDWNSLPAYFDNNSSSWISAFQRGCAFKYFFFPLIKKFLHEKKLPLKALVVIHRSPLYDSSDILELKDIKGIYSPPSIISSKLPNNEDVIMLLKRGYRKKFVSYIKDNNYDRAIIANLHNNMHEVVGMLVKAWDEIPHSMLSKHWRSLFPDICYEDFMQSEDEHVSLLKDFQQLNGYKDVNEEIFKKWLNCDSLLENNMDDEEIIAYVKNETKLHLYVFEPEEEIPDPRIDHRDAIDALDLTMRYIEQQLSSDIAADIICVRKWLNYAVKNIDAYKFPSLGIF